MRACRAACGHRSFVRQYQAERMRQEALRDERTGGYETELAEHEEIVTFRSWLLDHAAPSPDDASVEPTPDDWKPPPGF